MNFTGFRELSEQQVNKYTGEEEYMYDIFPYLSSSYVYITDKNIEYITPSTMGEAKKLLDILGTRKGTLLGFWEGQYKTDAFVVDCRNLIKPIVEDKCKHKWTHWRY